MNIANKIYKFDKILLTRIEMADINRDKTKNPYEKHNFQEIGNIIKLLRYQYKIKVLEVIKKEIATGKPFLINHVIFYEILIQKIEDVFNKDMICKEPYQKWSYQESFKELNLILNDYKNLFY